MFISVITSSNRYPNISWVLFCCSVILLLKICNLITVPLRSEIPLLGEGRPSTWFLTGLLLCEYVKKLKTIVQFIIKQTITIRFGQIKIQCNVRLRNALWFNQIKCYLDVVILLVMDSLLRIISLKWSIYWCQLSTWSIHSLITPKQSASSLHLLCYVIFDTPIFLHASEMPKDIRDMDI